MKRKRKSTQFLWIILASCFVLFLAALIWMRGEIESSGDLSVTELIEVPAARDFSRLEIEGAWEVKIIQSEDFDLELDYDPSLSNDLLVKLEREVAGNVLQIGWQKHRKIGEYKHKKRPLALVHMPILQGLILRGASSAKFTGFVSPQIAVRLTGASSLQAEDSRVEQLDLQMTGASKALLHNLEAGNAKLLLRGASEADLQMAGGTLTGSLSGASRVTYGGRVAEQRVRTSGSSTVVANN